MSGAPSPRRKTWSRIVILTVMFAVILGLLAESLVSLFLGVKVPRTDALFITGIGASFFGLIGLGISPPGKSTQSPSVTVGSIALSLLLSGLVLIASAVLLAS